MVQPTQSRSGAIGIGIDDHHAMSDNLKSQIAISKPPFRAEDISQRIHIIRGHRVMLDADLAELYGVTTKSLNQAVKRNLMRFPQDFTFRLTNEETANLKSQIVTSSGWGGLRRSLPLAFTEQGVAMLSGVLNSSRAVQVNIAIMRAFVLLRRMLLSNEDLARKVDALERRYDAQFKVVFDAIRAFKVSPNQPFLSPNTMH